MINYFYQFHLCILLQFGFDKDGWPALILSIFYYLIYIYKAT